jgi:hypothetical protein
MMLILADGSDPEGYGVLESLNSLARKVGRDADGAALLLEDLEAAGWIEFDVEFPNGMTGANHFHLNAERLEGKRK